MEAKASRLIERRDTSGSNRFRGSQRLYYFLFALMATSGVVFFQKEPISKFLTSFMDGDSKIYSLDIGAKIKADYGTTKEKLEFAPLNIPQR